MESALRSRAGHASPPTPGRKMTIQEEYARLHAPNPWRRIFIIGGVLILTGVLTSVFTWMHGQDNVEVDLVVYHTRVWTGDTSNPWAQGFAVSGDKFIAVGSNTMLTSYARKAKKVVDGSNGNFKFVVPGMFDCHIHLMRGGYALAGPQLREAKNKAEFKAIMRNHVANLPKGSWIREGNWNHENWGGILPDHTWLDEITDHPVIINRLDGHTVLVNKLALQIANITAATPDIEGGTIIRDSKGNPTGILKDNAMYLVFKHAPEISKEDEDKALQEAMHYVVSKGITSAHHIGIFAEARKDYTIFERNHAAGKLYLRIYFAADFADWREIAEKISFDGKGDNQLKIGNLKTFVDGSLGSKTALMFTPYTDGSIDTNKRSDLHDLEENDPDAAHEFLNQHGLVVTSEETLLEWVTGADKAGLQCSIHAIGDRANNILLNIYEQIPKINGPRDRRFRIEHAQHLRPEDIKRIAKMDVTVSMQPYHLIDDGQWAEKVLGKNRTKDAWPFKSLRDANARMAFGSDWFVAPPDPIQGIYAAVTRETLDGKNPDGWIPEQKITVEDALVAYTRNSAYASFDEHQKGMIKKGYLADFVLIDKNLFEIAPRDIWNAQVMSTYIGGKSVYEK